MKKLTYITLLISLITISFQSCKKKGCTDSSATNFDIDAKKNDGSCIFEIEDTTADIASNIVGYNILEKLVGIWNGPVTSPTPLGSFPLWIVDFRPISPSQISAKNELDSINDIFMSFFVCKHNNKHKIAFRSGGGFAGYIRNSYMIIDSVSEVSSHSFYRFSDPVSGGNRVYTNVTFKGDSIIMHTYTNQFNTLSQPVTHMVWKADLRDASSSLNAVSHFNYPQEEVTIDFSTTFDGLSDAVFYSNATDPYPGTEQPYLGVANVNIAVTNPTTIDPSKKVLISITTKPLFNGFNFLTENLKSRSRYVLVDAKSNTSFTFNYMHPGDYYINAIYDSNGDNNFSSSDYMNGSFDVPFSVADESTSSVNVNINFQIP